ncbi:hypothetical protein KIN20_003579 [Parelaphostrongylus tenuis]|uniref:Reverse transcriptase domain-containing protein n=1 Tax=Parelaphostrongylus tenuis TaxID=148309 RepID=A0AAD5M0F1_PARTN|nr:hypothetical protein KIN20_003579 [Parelaphostrongylus tenuis]
MESFDVTALYTNVSNESVMQAICELLTEHERTTNITAQKCWWTEELQAFQLPGINVGIHNYSLTVKHKDNGERLPYLLS